MDQIFGADAMYRRSCSTKCIWKYPEIIQFQLAPTGIMS